MIAINVGPSGRNTYMIAHNSCQVYIACIYVCIVCVSTHKALYVELMIIQKALKNSVEASDLQKSRYGEVKKPSE